jgi:hypothetical protein
MDMLSNKVALLCVILPVISPTSIYFFIFQSHYLSLHSDFCLLVNILCSLLCFTILSVTISLLTMAFHTLNFPTYKQNFSHILAINFSTSKNRQNFILSSGSGHWRPDRTCESEEATEVQAIQMVLTECVPKHFHSNRKC